MNTTKDSQQYFIVRQCAFELSIDDVLVTKTKYKIEQKDEFFSENYVSIYELETLEQFRRNGYAKHLLNEIFNYVRNTLKLNIITLIVYKNNTNAINLYLNSGFGIFMEYETSYSLIKNLCLI